MMRLKSKDIRKSQQCQQLSGSNCFNSSLQTNYQNAKQKSKRVYWKTRRTFELLNSLKENDHIEEKGLNKTANNVINSQEAIRGHY